MLKPDIETALNAQLNQEQTAAQEYLAMAAYFEEQSLKGFAGYMRRQAEEEGQHAMRIFDHICDRGGSVKVGAISAPTGHFESARGVFKAALQREQSNTSSIHALYRLAGECDDPATQIMLHWFIEEQVEEESWASEAIALLEMAAENRSALLMLDKRYGTPAKSG
jgi:ferritin